MAETLTRYQRTRCLRQAWLFERVGWVLMAALIAAACIGIFGNGWLSFVEVTGAGATVRYPRFARAHAPFVMTIDWQAQDGSVLSIDRAYLDHFAVTEVRPVPTAQAVDSQHIHYSFAVRDQAGRSSATFELRARRGGRLDGRIGIGANAAIAIRQVIFP